MRAQGENDVEPNRNGNGQQARGFGGWGHLGVYRRQYTISPEAGDRIAEGGDALILVTRVFVVYGSRGLLAAMMMRTRAGMRLFAVWRGRRDCRRGNARMLMVPAAPEEHMGEQ